MAPKSSSSSSESGSTSRSTSPESMKKPAESNRESEDSTSSSGSDEESNSSDYESAPSSPQDKGKKSQAPSSNGSFYPTQPYKPPSGFKAVKTQLPPSSTTSSILSNLRGKQLFHVTAPASIPLSKVKEVSLAKILQGEPVLKLDGVQYGIPTENISQGDLGGKTLFLYDSKAQTYYGAPTNNIPTYHVQEVTNLPASDDAVLAAAQSLVKPPRKHPKNLKMRFRPVGSGEGLPETLGTSSEESEGEEPTFKVPKGSNKEREERKRKHHHTEGEGSQPSVLPRKKSKKDSSTHETVEVDDDARHEKTKKSSKKRDEKKRKKSEK